MPSVAVVIPRALIFHAFIATLAVPWFFRSEYAAQPAHAERLIIVTPHSPDQRSP